MSPNLSLFGRAFVAARKEIPPKQWVIRMILSIVSGTANYIASLVQVFPWNPIRIGVATCLIIWLGEILWVMVTTLPLKLQYEVEQLRQAQSLQERQLKLEIVTRLRCEYQMDHPNGPKEESVVNEWITSRLWRMGHNWDPKGIK